MITIVSGTHRKGNNSILVAEEYLRVLNEAGKDGQILDLQKIPERFIWDDMFGNRSDDGTALIEKYIDKVDKFVFVVPEYNGSLPGMLKILLDAVEPDKFYGKRAALIGLSAGRFGNIRGLDDLTNIFNYIKVEVCPAKIYLPAVHKLLDENGKLVDDELNERIKTQLTLL